MNKPLILVVEDDPSVRNLITTTLKTNDYRYVVAPNGSAAIMETTSHNPEIILLDLGLPDMEWRSSHSNGSLLVQCSDYCNQRPKRG